MKTILKIIGVLSALALSWGAWQTSAPHVTANRPSPAAHNFSAVIEAAPQVTTTVYLPTIYKLEPPPVDLGIARVEVIQATTMNSAYRVHIANRPGILRVFPSFASTDSSTSVGNVSATLTCNPGGAQVMAGPIIVNQTVNEGNLSHTFNFNLPAGCLAVGTSYSVQIDPANTISENNEINNRYPAAGEQAFGYVAPNPVKVMFVPIDYRPQGCEGPSYLPNTATQNYLIWHALKVWPVSDITYFNWHTPLQFCQPLGDDGTGWNALLSAVTALHDGEGNGDTLYYGVMNLIGAGQCGSGCVAGRGWIGLPTAIGFSGFGADENTAGSVFTHEAGHNFGRLHAPGCNVKGPDNNYPATYVDGSGRAMIGQYGLDVSNSTIYAPASTFDYMSYCGPQWTSDYTYKMIYDFRATYPWLTDLAAMQDALILNGTFDGQGKPQLHTLLQTEAPIASTTTMGAYRVELLNATGEMLAARAFNPSQIQGDITGPEHLGSGFDLSGFQVALPIVQDVTTLRIYHGDTLLFERTATGPTPTLQAVEASGLGDGRAAARWQLTAGASTTTYHVRFSPDGGQTWMVLALNQTATTMQVPSDLLKAASQPLLEVQATDGVRVSALLIPLPVSEPVHGDKQ